MVLEDRGNSDLWHYSNTCLRAAEEALPSACCLLYHLGIEAGDLVRAAVDIFVLL